MASNNSDADLDDLLADGVKDSEFAPLNVEARSRRKVDVPVNHSRGIVFSFCSLFCSYWIYLCEYFPRFCFGLGCFCLLIPSYILLMTAINPTEEFGMVRDFSDIQIQSNLDQSVGLIDHWCLKGDDDCYCEDPLQPQPRADLKYWANVHFKNKKIVRDVVESNKNVDIAFLGSSVIEEMQGRWWGNSTDTDLLKLRTIFQGNFHKAEGAKVEAVALGLAGDTNPSILWRLMNGEMPTDFNPKIWWLELGMNDIGRMQCSEEVVVLGVLRIIEEIKKKKPTAEIVINSILPMTKLRGGINAKSADYKDSFFKDVLEKAGGKRRRQLRVNTARSLNWLSWGGKESKSIKMSAGQTKQKKYKTLTHVEQKLPLWTSITAINDMLEKFAGKHDRVTYFDATEIFAKRVTEEEDMWLLKTDMITRRGHPTIAGFEKWETEVIKKALTILNDIHD